MLAIIWCRIFLLDINWCRIFLLAIIWCRIFLLAIIWCRIFLLAIKNLILPVVLYGCETGLLTLRDECRLRVFENMVLRGIFGPKRRQNYMRSLRICTPH
jgi:hypothetical protein